MSLHLAQQFINELQTNHTFRQSLYMYDSPDDLKSALNEQGYRFTIAEFEEAYRAKLLKCREEEDAVILSEVCVMTRMLMGLSPSIPI